MPIADPATSHRIVPDRISTQKIAACVTSCGRIWSRLIFGDWSRNSIAWAPTRAAG
jgi:hypothetical protein